jgi:hypothetical protein
MKASAFRLRFVSEFNYIRTRDSVDILPQLPCDPNYAPDPTTLIQSTSFRTIHIRRKRAPNQSPTRDRSYFGLFLALLRNKNPLSIVQARHLVRLAPLRSETE